MSTAQLFAEALVAPARGLAAAAERRAILAPLLAATLASLAAAAVVTPRLDFDRAVYDAIDKDPQAQQLSPHELEERLAQARKVGSIASYAGAAFGPTLAALGAAVALSLAFRVAGARPAFAPTLAASSFAMVPLALRSLLLVPAATRMQGVSAEQVSRALPSSLGALLPATAPPRLLALAHAVDLFSLWGVALAALGMAHAAGVARGRALAVVALLWASWILVVHVALPGLTAGPR
jgi:Yip1 domain